MLYLLCRNTKSANILRACSLQKRRKIGLDSEKISVRNKFIVNAVVLSGDPYNNIRKNALFTNIATVMNRMFKIIFISTAIRVLTFIRAVAATVLPVLNCVIDLPFVVLSTIPIFFCR